jgi:hypothetical protein
VLIRDGELEVEEERVVLVYEEWVCVDDVEGGFELGWCGV